MTYTADGASLEVRFVEPSVDLATLVACLAEAVSRHAQVDTREQPVASLLTWHPHERVLAVDTRAVLAHLTRTRGFHTLATRFWRDADVPRSKARAHLGGRLVDGAAGALRQALDHLTINLDAALDSLVTAGLDLTALIQSDPERTIREMGSKIGLAPDDVLRTRTQVRRTAFGQVAKTQRGRQEEIARLMAAVEEMDGGRLDHFERLAMAVRELLRVDGLHQHEIEAALAFHREQAQTPGTQLSRFFDFLEDEALARIRLQVTFRMMEAIAAAAAARLHGEAGDDMALLVSYVRRTVALYQSLADPEGDDLLVNLSGEFGARADFSMHEEVVTAGFAGCLPVWPDWVTQIFERQPQGSGGASLREVSYRFRVNGVNPEDRLPAYVSRLARIRRILLEADDSPRVRRALAEIIVLACVVPTETGEPDDSVLETARELVRALERDGQTGLIRLLDRLRERAPLVERISRALVGVLKTTGTAVTASLVGRTWEYHLNVLRSLADTQRLSRPLETPLSVDEAPGKETIAFFQNIRITESRVMPGSLFSLRVRVRLAERSLELTGETGTGELVRTIPSRWIQVAWRPLSPAGSATGATSTVPALSAEDDCWLVQPRVEVRYDVRWLGLHRDPRRSKEEREQLLAAFRTAFTVLVYTALFTLLRRANRQGAAGESQGRLSVQMVRVQQRGREAGPMDGDQAVFAASQSVELALCRDFDVRMMGMVVDGCSGSLQRDVTRERRRGLYSAVLAGFPLVIARHGAAALEPAIGLISYVSRPCNDHPEQSGKRALHLSMARTYVATAVSDPLWGYQIQNESGLTQIREEGEADALPSVVVEEIRRLYEAHGCRHIMVLAHRYGTRRIGWAAARMRAPEFPRHLADVAARYPDLSLYPLVRDSFPVTRLRRRGEDEDAFEILQPDEHLYASPEASRDLRYAYTPVYSLATLHVVGEQGKPQSGVCTYFLLRDGGAGSIEMAEQIRANLLLSTSAVRLDLIAVLRGVHYLESERTPTKGGTLQPVLDPYRWMLPETIGHAGEIVVSTSRRRAGSIILSLPAILDHVSRVLHIHG